MSRINQWEVVAAVAMRACGFPSHVSAHGIAFRVDKLSRIARSLDRLNTAACNGDVECCACCQTDRIRLDEKQARKLGHVPFRCHYARVEGLEQRARDIGKELGIVVTTQRDPRGASVKLWADEEDGKALGVL